MNVKFRVKKCGVCGGQVRIVNLPKVTRYRDDVGLVVFGDVPAQECVDCGERFFPSEVALAMDKVIRERMKATETIELPYFPMRELATSK
jgi:YgiT-type zinc finger domain-containing protein